MEAIIAFVYQYPIQVVIGTWLVLAILSLRASVNSETHKRRHTYKNRSHNRKHSNTRSKGK